MEAYLHAAGGDIRQTASDSLRSLLARSDTLKRFVRARSPKMFTFAQNCYIAGGLMKTLNPRPARMCPKWDSFPPVEHCKPSR